MIAPPTGEADTLKWRKLATALRGGSYDGDGGLLHLAEEHGVGGVLWDKLPEGAPARASWAQRIAARELDHAAHLATLRALDTAFEKGGIDAVVLKGAAFAERCYPRPAARATTDIDLLVSPRDLARAAEAVGRLGYVNALGAETTWFLREHHHLYLESPSGPPVELHFHAFRGFGTTLPAVPLLARRRPHADWKRIGVLEPADEWLYLAVHAAGHQFLRFGWLYDLALLSEQLTDHNFGEVCARAEAFRFVAVARFTAALLVSFLALDHSRFAALGPLEIWRRAVLQPNRAPSDARRLESIFLRLALCDDAITATRHSVGTARSRLHHGIFRDARVAGRG